MTYREAVRPLLPLVLSGLVSALLVAPAAPAPATTSSPLPSLRPPASAKPAPAKPGARQIAYTQWDTGPDFRSGAMSGTRAVKGRLGLASNATGRRTFNGRSYDMGRWTSPWTTTRFGLTELIASWEATTPGDSWVEIAVRGKSAAGATSSYDVLGRWASGDTFITRRTVSGQTDDLAQVSVDTWRSLSAEGLTSFQLRVSLLRRTGAKTARPTLDTLGAVTSRLPSGDVTTSQPGIARGTVLAVPRYSQMIHTGHYPAWGNGGEAWCSPTSTSMVLGYYDALPDPASYAWVPRGHVDPWVDYAARMTYDASYRGTGNWPFNTAYAAGLAGHGFVTRLRSLREAERFIMAGIPLVASVAFGRGELTGAPISSTNGHLMVIVGFTKDGNVVVNDPAAADRSGVRRTYDRGQFENAWLPTTGGTVYVISDDAHPLPSPAPSNW